MNEKTTSAGRLILPTIIGAGLLLGGAAAGFFWHKGTTRADPAAALSPASRAAVEKVVHDYILENPSILPQAMENLRKQQDTDRLSAIRDQVTEPFPGAVLGNPEGKITLVEFTDFACGYCRQSVADVEHLIEKNPDLRIVIRELPVLSPESGDAARMALSGRIRVHESCRRSPEEIIDELWDAWATSVDLSEYQGDDAGKA